MTHKIVKILALVFCLVSPSLLQAEIPANTQSTSLHTMLKQAMPAVVNIYVQGQLPPSRAPLMQPNATPQMGPRFQDVGSGVIVDGKNGLIVTNAHVVQYSQIIVVTLNSGRRYQAKLLGSDVPSDIAVLKISADNLSSIPLADSDKAEVGDFVVAIGSPFGLLNQSVTSGVISALNRSDLGIEGYENFIQTDASINPGNSGGALVNMQGELVGINTAILSPGGGNIGIGFAIPSNMVKSVMEQLIRYGKVERGVMGVYVQDLTPDLADALNAHGKKGALITEVAPGSPAAKAGLKAKDIVIGINGKSTESGAELKNTLGLTRVGSTVELKVLRGEKTFTTQARLIPKEEAFAPTKPSFLSGVQLRDYDQLNFNNEEVKGVQVVDLDVNSAAALKGLRPGDIILSANNQPVTSVMELSKIASNKDAKSLLLEVQHVRGGNIFIVVDNN